MVWIDTGQLFQRSTMCPSKWKEINNRKNPSVEFPVGKRGEERTGVFS